MEPARLKCGLFSAYAHQFASRKCALLLLIWELIFSTAIKTRALWLAQLRQLYEGRSWFWSGRVVGSFASANREIFSTTESLDLWKFDGPQIQEKHLMMQFLPHADMLLDYLTTNLPSYSRKNDRSTASNESFSASVSAWDCAVTES